MDPAGKVAVVTGGNSGLGKATVRALLAAGAEVVTLDVSGKVPKGAICLNCDVSDPKSVRLAISAIQKPIHILVNCAGIGGLGPIASVDEPGDVVAMRKVIQVNLLGAINVTAEVAHTMCGNDPVGEDGERGVIVNACSIASFEGQEGMTAYTASKAALAALTLVWTRDLSKHAIRCMGIAPGFMDTPMVSFLPAELVAELIKDAEFPRRAGRSEEFARLALFIVENPLLNGEVIRLDAGTRPPARTTWSQGQDMEDDWLPPGFTEQKMTQAMRAFETALGAGKVFFEPLDRTGYKDKFAIQEAAHHPAGAIGPTTVEEVQAALRIANQFRLPVWPISRGKNLGYGGSAPHVSGSVVMDLSGMKKIEFDEEFGTVLLEPGVGFYDLYDYIQANNLPYWLSTPGNSWGSVIGNALDRGVGYTPYGENTKNLCGLEVVLPTGEVVRTGMGAFTNAPTWGAYPYGFGPGWDQMFVQSNFGVVTKANLWLMPEPESLMGMDVEFDKPGDLKAMVDTIGPLRRERVLQQSPSIGNWLRAAAVATTRGEWTDKPGALDDSVIDAIRRRFGLGWWGVSLRIYGREEVNKAAYAVLEKAMSAIGPLTIRPTNWVKGQPMEYSGWTGTPITFPMQNVNWYGGRGGHIGFSPIIPQSGSAALAQFQRTYARYKEYGMDYQGSFAFGERHLTNVNAMLFNKDDPAMMGRIDPFFRQLVADAKEHGYGEYRTHLDYMDLVADSYDWGGGALGKLNQKVKDVLDPNGILAPGKSGIWPKGARP